MKLVEVEKEGEKENCEKALLQFSSSRNRLYSQFLRMIVFITDNILLHNIKDNTIYY
jgi:hypothetical protein